MSIYQQRIEQLRSFMLERGLDAVVLTGSDPHNSEYPADHWKQIEWLTGFTGEAAELVITLTHAGLWTDSRYFIQAKQQLADTGVILHKTRVPDQILIPEWLRMELGCEAHIGIDGLCTSVAFVKELCGEIVSSPGLLSRFWADRPAIPQTPIYSIDLQAGESRLEKIDWLRKKFEYESCSGVLLTELDQIAWLLNVRASDIEYNPLVISYLLLTSRKVQWFVEKSPADDPQSIDSFEELSADGIEICGYEQLSDALHSFNGRLMIDSSSLNYEIYKQLSMPCLDTPNPIPLRKAVKTASEIEDMQLTHIQDGIAVERFLYWLEKSVQAGKQISEWDASVKLGQLRSEIDEYLGDSFETISAYRESAALPHYSTPRKDAPTIGEEGLYLCDSGGQFVRGTTDITRTVAMGDCSPLEREDYTLALKAHIDLAMAVFPAGTAGCQIDALAREPLWKAGRNFGHGTGHGIGYCLCVHEGPHDIRQNFNPTPLLPGMIVSDEPGIYREGMHGIRHENLLLCVDAGINEFGTWRAFEPLTLCHFDTTILKTELMNHDEISWLNAYHERVYTCLAPYLSETEQEWLKTKTAPIAVSSMQPQTDF